MIRRILCLTLTVALLTLFGPPRTAQAAPVEIQFWHSMGAQLGVYLNEIVDKFNASQSDYKVVAVYKGNYEQSMAAGIAAYRAGDAPAILQVYEVGTATMMAAKQAVIPVWQVFQKAGVPLNTSAFIPTIASYYGEGNPLRLVSMPFNSSTSVLYYNKDAFKKAGLDPNKPPKTWDEVAADAAKLKAAGMPCGFTTGWQGWIQVEQFSAWHGLPIATEDNGFDGLGAKLEFNDPLEIKHITMLQQMAQAGTFTYVGRKDESTPKFYSGDCGIMMGSSGSYADVAKFAKFNFAEAMMPYDPSVKGAPQNAIIGGASLWVLNGKPPEVYKGVAKFFNFLASPEIAGQWSAETGYLPITKFAYANLQLKGFYNNHPEVPIQQMLLHPPLAWTRGLRLGNMPQIRTVVDEELESVWSGKKSAKSALDDAVSRGNDLLRSFQTANGG
ncbi:MAG: sn-glycerol-3-phosphate ABC transporter substrate-binding protein UgpB [Candidatus Eremiobacteraeota bacterium]|nr:sn-glycerol-3-phosphate ABC transporter substrate-binding protein UgpB [Candidatus Eremiobacteraeota bacterium]